MSKGAIDKPPAKDSEPIESAAEAFQPRIQEENNKTFQELRDQAQAVIAAVKGSRAIRRPEDWEGMFQNQRYFAAVIDLRSRFTPPTNQH